MRDHLQLVGTKYGCGIAQCGACTIHLDSQAMRSCLLPIAADGDQKITIIEGLSENMDHPVQKAWKEEDVDQFMQGNLCRCGTYQRIRKAIKTAAQLS